MLLSLYVVDVNVCTVLVAGKSEAASVARCRWRWTLHSCSSC